MKFTLAKAYNAGIRKIIFAIKKESVNPLYFEGSNNNNEVISHFNEKIELIHLKELEEEALKIVRNWETKPRFT